MNVSENGDVDIQCVRVATSCIDQTLWRWQVAAVRLIEIWQTCGLVASSGRSGRTRRRDSRLRATLRSGLRCAACGARCRWNRSVAIVTASTRSQKRWEDGRTEANHNRSLHEATPRDTYGTITQVCVHTSVCRRLVHDFLPLPRTIRPNETTVIYPSAITKMNIDTCNRAHEIAC